MRGDFLSQLQPKPCVHDGVLQSEVGLRSISIAVTETQAEHVDASMREHVVWHRQQPTPKSWEFHDYINPAKTATRNFSRRTQTWIVVRASRTQLSAVKE